jgi:hypothetical protein
VKRITALGTFLISTVAAAGDLHPIVEVQAGYLFGATKDGKWLDSGCAFASGAAVASAVDDGVCACEGSRNARTRIKTAPVAANVRVIFRKYIPICPFTLRGALSP